MQKKTAYHHGDLRKTLLTAAEQELKAKGMEKFSLRGVAREAGVSHAAPAHHFGDVTGLLTALAVEGWQRLLTSQLQHQAKAEQTPTEQLIASAMGYLAFARQSPELFKLVFSSRIPNRCEPAFMEAGEKAFDHLVKLVNELAGNNAYHHPSTMIDVLALWSLVHGIASLLDSDFLLALHEDTEEREKTIRAMVTRYLKSDTSPEKIMRVN